MRGILQKKIGNLKTLTIDGRAGGTCVVLFHGYGADASDLVPLAEMMGLSKDITWVFPEAPMEVIIAPGVTGKAWFPIDTKRLENAMRSGKPADMSATLPGESKEREPRRLHFYEDLLKKHSSVVLGGFSQGAMLTTELTLSHRQKPAGVVLMSAGLICKERWQKMALSCAGLSFIQSHGKNDSLLGFEYAENLFQLLTDSGLHGEFVSFNGGHEIPPKVIEKIGQYLAKICR